MGDIKEHFWNGRKMKSEKYTCGYCGAYVSSDNGMQLGNPTQVGGVFICPNCNMPTFIYKEEHTDIQVPGVRFGVPIENIPEKVNSVYEEARKCYAANAYTGTVLLCRKLLMHVAVDLGAETNKRFIEYINYLRDNHYVSVKSDEWVDKIRKYGNEANHEIKTNTSNDAKTILRFCEMLLKMNYEYPSMASKE